jgi:hypothetical protein
VASTRRRRRRRRRLVVGATVVCGDSEQVNEASCRPASWRIRKRALSPLVTHRSNRVRKSSLVTGAEVEVDGKAGGEIVDEVRGGTPSRTRLAHVGAAQGATPSNPSEGEAWAWGDSVDPAGLYLPSPPSEGEAVWRGEYCTRVAVDRPAGPSARGEGEAAGIMAWGPLSRGGEREHGPHTSGVSSELSGVSSELSGVSSELSGVSSEPS